MEKLLFKSYSDLVNDIKQNIHVFSQYDFDLVVGIPRSGMIPAYLVSAYLNLDCCDVETFIENRALQRGITRTTKANLSFPHDAKRILFLDDSVYSGESLEVTLNKIPINLKSKIVSAAIYATGIGKKKVDIFVEALEGKKLFEWGIFHNNLINSTCFDMDGVLCKDCLPHQNDDGELYIDFIKNVEPLFIPTKKIHTIITNRLEKYRSETVAWLERFNIEYDQLIMLDLPDKGERAKIDAGIDHKGKHYKKMTDTVLFIESSLNQSKSIALVSGKPVYCVDENIFIEPDLNSVLKNNLNGLIKRKYYSFKHKLKMFLIGNNR